MIKQQERSEEYTRLIVEHGNITRNLQFTGWKPTDEEREIINIRYKRLVELAEMLGYDKPADAVNEQLVKWLKMNPLALTKRRVKQLIEGSPSNVDGQVSIQIGDLGYGSGRPGGYYYQVLASDCEITTGVLRFTVPESVAEHFRQQGRREIQSEMRNILNVARA